MRLAISTGGASPVLARRVAALVEAAVPPGFARLAAIAARYRDAVKRRFADVAARRAFWERALEGDIGRLVLEGREDEARALIELVAARGIAQGELGNLLGLEKSTVSRLAAGLERKGWLRRGRDEENQRFMRLYLTPEGRVIAARVWQAWQSRQARIMAGLSAEERAGLAAGLRGLVRGLAAEGLLEDAVAAPDPAGSPGTPETRRYTQTPSAR